MPPFNQAIRIAKEAEENVQRLFAESGFALSKVPRLDRSFYDLYNDDLSVEVKFDMMSNVTTNLAFEYENSKQGKASGVNITKATFWVHIISEGERLYLIINTNKLKDLLVSLSEEGKIKYVKGGDDNAKLALVKKVDIMPYFVILNHLDITERQIWIANNINCPH